MQTSLRRKQDAGNRIYKKCVAGKIDAIVMLLFRKIL